MTPMQIKYLPIRTLLLLAGATLPGRKAGAQPAPTVR